MVPKKKKKILRGSVVPQIDLNDQIDAPMCAPGLVLVPMDLVPNEVISEKDALQQSGLRPAERRSLNLAASFDEPNDNLSEERLSSGFWGQGSPVAHKEHDLGGWKSFWGAAKKAVEEPERERSTASKVIAKAESVASENIPSPIERALSTRSDSLVNPLTPMDSPCDLTVSPRLAPASSPQPTSQDITENIIYITDNGNYCLQVLSGCCHHKFLVSETIISHASEKLRSEIQQAAEHPLFGDMKLLKIATGSPEAWNVILQILHFSMDESFFNLDVRIIIEITTICTRYALHNPVMTWATLWLQQNSTKLQESDFEDWIFPAIEFGALKDEVENFTQLLSDQCGTLSDCGTWISRSGIPIRTEFWPQSFLDSVLKMRLGKLESLIEKLGYLSDFFVKDEQTLHQSCTDEACINLAYGSILRSLSKSRLLDIKNGGQVWHGSVIDIHGEIENISCQTMVDIVPGHDCSLAQAVDNLICKICS